MFLIDRLNIIPTDFYKLPKEEIIQLDTITKRAFLYLYKKRVDGDWPFTKYEINVSLEGAFYIPLHQVRHKLDFPTPKTQIKSNADESPRADDEEEKNQSLVYEVDWLPEISTSEKVYELDQNQDWEAIYQYLMNYSSVHRQFSCTCSDKANGRGKRFRYRPYKRLRKWFCLC